MVSSSNPTVLTQYPRLQKCSPVTFLLPRICRWIRTAPLALDKPYRKRNAIASGGLYKLYLLRNHETALWLKSLGRASTPNMVNSSDQIGWSFSPLISLWQSRFSTNFKSHKNSGVLTRDLSLSYLEIACLIYFQPAFIRTSSLLMGAMKFLYHSSPTAPEDALPPCKGCALPASCS
jgi:hypothetical protein